MTEYIRKEDAIDVAREDGKKIPTVAIRIMHDIKAIHSADVVPVAHGQWMCVPETWGTFSSRYYCSKCGNDAIINSYERYVLSDFCPNCGARMDEAEDENG